MLKTPLKIGLVIGGYVAALLVAVTAVTLNAGFSGSGAQAASSGMAAFGDSLLFLAVLAVASAPATVAALYFLRPHSSFWRGLSFAAIMVAVTGLAAVPVYFAGVSSYADARLASLSPFALLRILAAPALAPGFLLCGVFAPQRPARITLFAVSLVEVLVFVGMMIAWFVSPRQ